MVKETYWAFQTINMKFDPSSSFLSKNTDLICRNTMYSVFFERSTINELFHTVVNKRGAFQEENSSIRLLNVFSVFFLLSNINQCIQYRGWIFIFRFVR